MNLFRAIKSIRVKLMILFIPLIFLSSLLITTFIFLDAREELTDLTMERVDNRLLYIAEQMNNEFNMNEQVAKSIRSLYTVNELTILKQEYREFMESIVALNENTLGAGIWLEPFVIEDEQYFGPYVYKDGDEIIYTEEYETADYDYPNTDWYREAKAVGEEGVAWTDPYYDEATGITMITTAIPIYQNAEFVGVVTADYDLTTIQNLVAEESLEQSGFYSLVSSNGQFIAHAEQNRVMAETIHEDETLLPLSEAVTQAERGVTTVTMERGDWQAYFTTFERANWNLVAMAPDRELFQVIQSLLIKAITITIAVILVATVVIFLFSQQLSRQVGQFLNTISQLAKGELNTRISTQTKDEFGQMGQHYNEAVSKLSGMIEKVSQTSEGVAASAEQLSASADETNKSVHEVTTAIVDLAENNNEQSSYSVQLNKRADHIVNQMQSMSNNIQKLKQTNEEHSKLAQEGNEHVRVVVNQMNEINHQVKDSATTIHALNQKSVKIEEIISMITNIAEQTNLLALNAAIEAARAGEHGKGFAVVADEVRKLAEQSSAASGEVNLLIQEIQQGVNQSVEYMDRTTKSTNSGILVVEETGQAFGKMAQSIEEVHSVTETFYETVTSIVEETEEMKQLVESVKELSLSNDESAQSVSAASEEQSAIIEEMSKAISELANMSMELQEELSKFHV
ncbi:methyl-accepting chemotaxis protein [Halalkalibacter hemicellulosilyticus]|uniref:Methyl-accepting chemotaxis sensory transducer n=1 Tax=Halalkalibacter hemicellulosilyticusJCM 9152 TaxID=1236971 RepID=W4QCF0_9BACI|nr:methyl-accepting chemotaxis protein [Halalkalibacter hemicellulosilyticus]GAE29632.1 methyl-accepting chemotaxis sensory transducer [Halalkalibacter hemicellulosilyticusJCM 9152]